MNDMQRTDEWFAARRGAVGASRVADAIRKTKAGYGATRLTYMAEVIAERLTGASTSTYVSREMQHGIDTEPMARAMYETLTGNLVSEVGSVPHPTIDKAGASPDGLIGNAGLVEIKCPKTETHIKTLLSGEIDPDYIVQMQFQMACTGRQWVDFVSYDPRLPRQVSIFIKRVERDEVVIAAIQEEVVKFLADVDAAIEKMMNSDLAKEIGNG